MAGITGETNTTITWDDGENETILYKCGIRNEDSDVRAHVCPVVERVYVYPTPSGLKAIESGEHKLMPARQKGLSTPTALGYLVPPFDIEYCVGISLRPCAWESLRLLSKLPLSEKGRKATYLILQMLMHGLFPIPATGQEINDLDMQIKGQDIVVNTVAARELTVQVKCDYDGGEKQLGGTGNLYLQIAERNPKGIH